MDIYQTRNTIKATGKTLADMPLRVVYYARVSTEKDEQLNSLNNQQAYYENFITANDNWLLVGRYIDEGLSAITTTKRENFHTMIADAKLGSFDFVITKEISRFARNTLDSIQYTRELLNSGVAVWFQQDSINTIDDDSEMRLAIMSSLAQEESRKLSSRIRFGHSQAIKNGVVMGNSRIYGYDKDSGKLVINDNEAEMVRLIFSLYATGDYSTPKIEKILFEKGYRNFKGGAINRNVLRNIIPNPKYKGYYCGNKVKVVDMFTKKQKFLAEDEWELYKDHDKVPPIVDEELWEKANAVFAARSEAIKSRRTSYKTGNLFTGKIICAEHNTPFYMKARKIRKDDDSVTWVCSHRIKNGKDSCETYGIKEKELVEILTEVLSGLSSSVNDIFDKYLQYLKTANSGADFEGDIKAIESSIAKINDKKDKLLELNIEGRLTNAEFEKRNNACNDELHTKEQELKQLHKKRDGRADQSKNILRFKNELLSYFNSNQQELTPGIVNTFVDKIYVTPSDEDNTIMHLQILLNTGDTTQTTITTQERRRGLRVKPAMTEGDSTESTVRRSGHTIKKMIEAQEKQMAGGQSSL